MDDIRIVPLAHVVPWVLPVVVSADGHGRPRHLIVGWAKIPPNPYHGATERHG